MRYNIEKILDNEKNIVGYKTIGLKSTLAKELVINLPIDKNLAESIFNNISTRKDIPSVLKGVTNTDIYIKDDSDNYIIIFPDEKGLYPWEPECDELFKNQIKKA